MAKMGNEHSCCHVICVSLRMYLEGLRDGVKLTPSGKIVLPHSMLLFLCFYCRQMHTVCPKSHNIHAVVFSG